MAIEPLKYRVEKGLPTLIPVYSKYVDARVLAADTSEEVTVPSGAVVVIMTPDVDVWVDFNATSASIPSADVTDGTSAVLLPAGVPHARVISGLSSFGMIAGAAAKISLEWYL